MENQELERKKVFRSIGYTLFTMLLVVILVQILMIVLINILAPEIESNPWYIGLLIGVPFYFAGFPVFLWRMKKIPDSPKGKSKSMSFKEIIVVFLISMAGTYIFNIVGSVINNLISSLKGSEVVNPLDATLGGVSILPTIIFVGILSPIIEEIVFRGVLLNKLRRYGDKLAIQFTALSFALFHGNLSQFFYAFILGLIFAYITIKTNRIRYAIILHIAVNIFGSVIMPGLALSNNPILVILTGIIVIFFILTGTILYIRNSRSIKLEFKEDEESQKVSKKIVYGNRGMIIYYIVCLGLFVSAIMA